LLVEKVRTLLSAAIGSAAEGVSGMEGRAKKGADLKLLKIGIK